MIYQCFQVSAMHVRRLSPGAKLFELFALRWPFVGGMCIHVKTYMPDQFDHVSFRVDPCVCSCKVWWQNPTRGVTACMTTMVVAMDGVITSMATTMAGAMRWASAALIEGLHHHIKGSQNGGQSKQESQQEEDNPKILLIPT